MLNGRGLLLYETDDLKWKMLDRKIAESTRFRAWTWANHRAGVLKLFCT